MKKILISIIFFLLMNFIIPHKVEAAVLFEDNFDDGNDIGWTKIGISPQAIWKVENGVYKGIVTSPSTIVDTVAGNEAWGDYVLEFDMYPKQGVDKHIKSKWITGVGFTHEIHFTNGGFDTSGGSVVFSPIVNGQSYHMKLVYQGKNISFYRNDQLMLTETYDGLSSHGKIGFRVGTGSSFPSEVWFDNVKVTTLNDENSNDLEVPLLKQTDPLWANDVYDSAPDWQSPGGGTTIGRLGCALTSAAMVMQYYGLTKMPDGITNLDPQSLNNWMNSLSDSNFRNGSTNWAALAGHLTPSLASINNANFDRFEVKMENFDTQKLDNYINDKNPVILNVPGHFVVAKGIDAANNSYSINDPYYDRNSLNSYSNNYSKSVTFVPAHSDSSYLVFVVDPSVQIKLKDSQGNIVGETFIEDSVQDELQLSTNLIGPLKALYYAKPPSDNYVVEISSSSIAPYFLQGYLYDINGNVKMFEQKDVLAQNDTDTYLINFDKNNSTGINIGQTVTLATLKNDVIALYSLGHIKKEFYKELLEKIKEVEKNQNKKGEGLYHKLRELKKEIGKKKGIDAYAVAILSNDLTLLINSLPPISSDED